MNLVIDYGNTAAKVGIFRHHEMVEKHVFTAPEELQKFLQNFYADSIIISSVSVDADMVSGWATHTHQKFTLTADLPLPVRNHYATPHSLGVDRIAGVCGARQLFPDNPCLVIDAGTCITYDFLSQDGAFMGGGISPGLAMRFEAVHTFTARLPLVSIVLDVLLIRDSMALNRLLGAILE